MATATYEMKHRRWVLNYKKITPDGRTIYARKRIVDKRYSSYGAREARARLREMEAEAERLEVAATTGITLEAPEKRLTAVEYMEAIATHAEAALQAGKPCAGILSTSDREKGTREGVVIVRRFAAYLEKHAPAASLDEITPKHIIDFAQFERANGFAKSTVRNHLSRLGWIFDKLAMEEKIKRNPLQDRKGMLRKIKPNEVVFSRRVIQPLYFKKILETICTTTEIRKPEVAFNAFAVFYLGITTGWRESDLVTKKRADVLGFGEGKPVYLKNLHHKTKSETGIETKIKLTPFGQLILKQLREINGDGENLFILSEKKRKTTERQDKSNQLSFQMLMKKVFNKSYGDKELRSPVVTGKKRQYGVSFHSLRGTLITHLIEKGFSESLVMKLAGHSANSTIERKHYQHFTPESFSGAVERMEADYFLDFFMNMKKMLPAFQELQERAREITLEEYTDGSDKRRAEIKKKMEAVRLVETLKNAGITYADLRHFFTATRHGTE